MTCLLLGVDKKIHRNLKKKTRSQIDTVTTERASYMLTNPPLVFHQSHFGPNKSNGSL